MAAACQAELKRPCLRPSRSDTCLHAQPPSREELSALARALPPHLPAPPPHRHGRCRGQGGLRNDYRRLGSVHRPHYRRLTPRLRQQAGRRCSRDCGHAQQWAAEAAAAALGHRQSRQRVRGATTMVLQSIARHAAEATCVVLFLFIAAVPKLQLGASIPLVICLSPGMLTRSAPAAWCWLTLCPRTPCHTHLQRAGAQRQPQGEEEEEEVQVRMRPRLHHQLLQLVAGSGCADGAGGCLLSVTDDRLGPCPTVTAACDGSTHLRLCALPHPLQQAGLQRQLLREEVRKRRRPARIAAKVRGRLNHLGAGIGWGSGWMGAAGMGKDMLAWRLARPPLLSCHPMLQTAHPPSPCCACPLQWGVTPPCERERFSRCRLKQARSSWVLAFTETAAGWAPSARATAFTRILYSSPDLSGFPPGLHCHPVCTLSDSSWTCDSAVSLPPCTALATRLCSLLISG